MARKESKSMARKESKSMARKESKIMARKELVKIFIVFHCFMWMEN
jgi:hypothetical protein